MISTTREHLVLDLRSYGEDPLADRVHQLSDSEMTRIGELAFKNASGPDGVGLLAKALALAAVEVMEGAPRPLRRNRRKRESVSPARAVPEEFSPVPPMRELIAAFSAAARAQMTAEGWRKRSGDIYTLELGDGVFAWLGLNRATQLHPLHINPVVGVRHEPLMELVDALTGNTMAGVSATLACPIGYLMPERLFLQLEVASFEDATPAAERLRALVASYGLPFARRHASPEALEAALRDGTDALARQYAPYRVPALLAVTGRAQEARAALEAYRAELGARMGPAAEAFRAFAKSLARWLDEHEPPG